MAKQLTWLGYTANYVLINLLQEQRTQDLTAGFARSASPLWVHRSLTLNIISKTEVVHLTLTYRPPLMWHHLWHHQLCFLRQTSKSGRISWWDRDCTQLASLDRSRALCDHLKYLLKFFYFGFHFIWGRYQSWLTLPFSSTICSPRFKSLIFFFCLFLWYYLQRPFGQIVLSVAPVGLTHRIKWMLPPWGCPRSSWMRPLAMWSCVPPHGRGELELDDL